MPLTAIEDRLGEPAIGVVVECVRTQLDQADAVPKGMIEPPDEALGLEWIGAGDEHTLGQLQGADDGAVGRREVGGVHGIRMTPIEWLALAALGGASILQDQMHVEDDVTITIVMADAYQWAATPHLDAKLLGELAPEPLGRRLARLQLTARKLPETALMHMVGTLGDQDTASAIPDRADHDMDPSRLNSGIRR